MRRIMQRLKLQVHEPKEIAFMEHAIANLRGNGFSIYLRERADSPKGDAAVAQNSAEWARRDAMMAENQRWLIEDVYAGKKIIVWAHNAHVTKVYFALDWRSAHARPQPGGMKSMGAYLAERMKDNVYTIALTTYEGEEDWANGQMHGAIAPAAEGSLESRLHRLGKPYVFVNFRTLRVSPTHPMHRPQSMRISGYGPPTNPYGNDTLPDLTKALDAVIFVDHMAPATRVSTH